MRISRSPQNGGFHKCTGGGPFFDVAALAAAAMPSARTIGELSPLMTLPFSFIALGSLETFYLI
jgi:hypothetical protein